MKKAIIYLVIMLACVVTGVLFDIFDNTDDIKYYEYTQSLMISYILWFTITKE